MAKLAFVDSVASIWHAHTFWKLNRKSDLQPYFIKLNPNQEMTYDGVFRYEEK